VATHGLAHQQQFEVACQLGDDTRCGTGLGLSRRAAEQAAASMLLEQLLNGPEPGHD
ncbi:MAG: putative dsRNA-binding protein, partial [Burkholderiaceae bacterium]